MTSGSAPDGLVQTLGAVLQCLDCAGADHALFGGLVAGRYGRDRATCDVDVLVPGGALDAMARALSEHGYAVARFHNLVKFDDPIGRRAGGDCLAAETNAVLRAAFASRGPSSVLQLPVSIVSRPAFVALKFEAAATAARTPGDRLRDVADVQGVLQREFPAADEAVALEIAALMYPGAVDDLIDFLDDLRRGRFPEVVRRAQRRPRRLIARALGRVRRSRF